MAGEIVTRKTQLCWDTARSTIRKLPAKRERLAATTLFSPSYCLKLLIMSCLFHCSVLPWSKADLCMDLALYCNLHVKFLLLRTQNYTNMKKIRPRSCGNTTSSTCYQLPVCIKRNRNVRGEITQHGIQLKYDL